LILKQTFRDELESFNFSFDDDFFEFVKTGVLLKSVNSYCIDKPITDNDNFDLPGLDDSNVDILAIAKYSRSFFYKYLEIYYRIRVEKNVPGFKASYATTSDCMYNKNSSGDNTTFERSEDTGNSWISPGESTYIHEFSRKPYNSTSKLEQYILKVDYELSIDWTEENYPFQTWPMTRHYDTDNVCSY